ncbi:endoplasmic reticulum metallopeptidase 1-like [Onthophagus taurus]|uniref:endoplasmic reticulum metallopeptidase 1-like n=1 Tax=Onthophagus taurus TaxID=166361 RepID=UPI000C20E51E|nr:endoplasmic reticulum metallopeptidase 1-like [Onthophagus taurus]
MSNNDQHLRKRFKDRSTSPQSPFGQEEKEKTKVEKPYPSDYMLWVFVLMIIVFLGVIIVEKQLPKGLKVAEEHRYKNRFVAERAYDHLKKLTALGPRVTGSHVNEIEAVNLLKTEIGEIMKNSKSHHVIELDVQTVDGSFALQFLDGMTNTYSGLQNVVVKIGSRINSPHSLLINCHFDSVPDSPGGSDDGAGCAVMLEMLRVISQSEKTLKHNIIFLFNGGEENFLPASHGFITQHKWAKEIRAFINLEACGAGGREVLFQAGPNHPWLLETYSEEVPYPYASSLAQEIFQSGVIPGDTDYRIFRDFGNLSGLDFAWSSNGYVYHTKFDSIDQIPLGSLQRTGDNILSLALGMAQGHQLSDVENYKAGNLVFFDFLGAFVIRWPMMVSDIINTLSVIFSVYSVLRNVKEHSNVISKRQYYTRVLKAMGAIVMTWVLAVLTAVLIAIMLNVLDRKMAWYGKPVWVFFLYMVPTALVAIAVIFAHAKYTHKDIDVWPWTIFQIYYDAYLLHFTLLLGLGTLLRIRSSFIPLLWVVFATAGNVIRSIFLKRQRGKKWLFLHIGVMGLPFVQSFYLFVCALYLFIPIMGRAGAGNNSEVLIAVMVSFLIALRISFAVPLILIVRDVQKIFRILLGIFLLSIGMLLLTTAGFPYSGEPGALAPQRFMLCHVQRTMHDNSGDAPKTSSGYWVIDMDINSPYSVHRYVPEMYVANPVDEDCKKYLFCGLPYLVPVMSMIWKTHFISAPPPNLEKQVTANITRYKIDVGERITIKLDGPVQTSVMFSPVPGVQLRNWSLPSEPLVSATPWNGRDNYFVFYGVGIKHVPLNLAMDFVVPKGHQGPIVDLAVGGQYFFGSSKVSTKQFQEFLNKFPSWTAITSWSASYESWVL